MFTKNFQMVKDTVVLEMLTLICILLDNGTWLSRLGPIYC